MLKMNKQTNPVNPFLFLYDFAYFLITNFFTSFSYEA